MAKVEVDLTEYDEMRNARKNAEEQVKELKLELETLKKSYEPNNILVKNIYMKKDIDITDVANGIVSYIRSKRIDLSSISFLLESGRFFKEDIANYIRFGIERAKSVVDYTNTEVKGFNELEKEVRQTLEDNYKISMKTKERQLEESKKNYNEKYEKLEEEFEKQYKELETKREILKDLQDGALKVQREAEEKIKEYENKNWFKRLFKL